MSNTINLTLDMDDSEALIRASETLRTLANPASPAKPEIEKPAAPATTEKPAAPAKVENMHDDNTSLKGAEDMGSETAASPAGPVGVELDSAGLPHDSRIHSRNKTKLAKTQQWKKARGVDPQLVLTVEAELRQLMAIPPATTETPASPAAPAIVETPASPAAPAIVETPATTGTITTFPELMGKITAAIGAGTLSNDRINEVCISKGLASLPLIAARQDLIPAIAAELFPNG